MRAAAAMLGLATALAACGTPHPLQRAAPTLLAEGDTAFNGRLKVAEAKIVVDDQGRKHLVRLVNAGREPLSFSYSIRYQGPSGMVVDPAPTIRNLTLRPGQEALSIDLCGFERATGVLVRIEQP